MMRTAATAMFLLIAAAAGPATAQDPDTTRAAGRTLGGRVVDTRDLPVDSVQVSLLELKLSVRSDRNGVFALENIPPGDYTLLVRRIGFEPIQREIAVADDTRGILIRIVPLPQTLPAVVTRAARIGVSGIVMDTDDKPLAGASVILNGSRRTTTGDDGRFFLRAPVGKYLLQVRQTGYATQMIGLEVHSDSGRDVAVWLSTTTREAAAREAALMEGVRIRMLNRSPVWSKLFTREDMNRIGFTSLEQIAIAGSGRGIAGANAGDDGECMATVDGLYRMPLWTVDPADIEFAEVYGSRPARPRRGNLRSGPVTDRYQRPACPQVYVWLRK